MNNSGHNALATDDALEGHRAWLTRLIVSRTGATTWVDDVLQEIGLAVARSNNRPENEEEIKPWLCTIAIHQCALVLRKSGRQRHLEQRVADEEANTSPESHLDDPIFWLLHRESADLVREAIAEMNDGMRTLLLKKYVEGQSYSQLAEELGAPRHVAEYRVTVAKKTLRGLLIERGLGKEDIP